MEHKPITEAATQYLADHHNTSEAMGHVSHVLQVYNHMVGLATQRALEQLQEPEPCRVIQFPISRLKHAQNTPQEPA